MSAAVASLEWAWAGLPCLGERVSGDLVLIEEDASPPCAVVVDVAGHGPTAHATAERIRALDPLAAPMAAISDVVRRIHDGLAGSGDIAAVMALRVLDEGDAATLEYSGIGNVRLAVSGNARRDEGRPGMAGQPLPALRVQRLRLVAPCLVAVFTDGLAGSLTLGPELEGVSLTHLPSLLLRRHGRRHDDATCLVLRIGER